VIVADTNLISYFLLEDSHSEIAVQVYQKDSDWIAPFLWRSEFRNIIALYVRQAILTSDESLAVMDTAIELMTGQEYAVSSYKVLQLAHQSNQSAYDCEFVAVAEDMEIPLVTSDKKLLKAFPEIAISPQDFVGGI